MANLLASVLQHATVVDGRQVIDIDAGAQLWLLL